jgi:hypothetical protein
MVLSLHQPQLPLLALPPLPLLAQALPVWRHALSAAWLSPLSARATVLQGFGMPLPLRMGLLQGAALGGLVGSAALLGAILRAGRYAAAHRKGGLFVRRRPPKDDRCPRCAGFRIQRCTICRGTGVCKTSVSTHSLTAYIYCPFCSSTRHVRCTMCAGSGRRPPPDGRGHLIQHGVRTAIDLVVEVVARVWDATQGQVAFVALPRGASLVSVLPTGMGVDG